MNINAVEKSVKEWLYNQVANQLIWENFNIISTKNITIDNETKKIFFVFRCGYQWRLNAWLKNVNTDIIVVYNITKQKIIYCSEYSINI